MNVKLKVKTYLPECIRVQDPLVSSEQLEKHLCPRHDLCLSCNNKMSRRKSGELTKICSWLQEEVGVKDWGVLTVTLPGRGHWIRTATLEQQYRYFTESINSKRGKEPMRGLQAYLRSQGAEGGFVFLEATYSSKDDWWHLHAHILLVSRQWIGLATTLEMQCTSCNVDVEDCECWRPGETTMPMMREVVGGGWSKPLERLGFGTRQSYDDREPGQGVGGFVKYCTQLAYLAKPIQFEKKIPKRKHQELSKFFRHSRPRLIRRWGIARQSKAQREDWDVIYHDRNNI